MVEENLTVLLANRQKVIGRKCLFVRSHDETRSIMDEYLRPEFDFSLLTPLELSSSGNVTHEELAFVFLNPRSRAYDAFYALPEDCTWTCIGFSNRARCISADIFFDNGKHYFLDIKLANEYEIQRLWCDKSRNPS